MSKKETEASDPYEPVAPPEAEAQEEISLEPADTGSGLPNPALGEVENVPGYEAKFSPRALIEVRDIGELSYGAPRKIHGTDDRVQISNTGTYPWSAIVSLYIESPSGNGIGTGFFIGPKTIATCGHCVFIRPKTDPSKADWATRITVMPGRNDSLSPPNNLPFGSVVAPRSSLRSVKGWTERGENGYDYGAIVLSTELGRRTGWFGFGAYTNAQLLAMIGNLSGYPGDKGGGTQWFHASKVTNVDDLRVFYQIDMMPGHSGSPVFTITSQGRYAFAINAYQWSGDNFGTRINGEVTNLLAGWKG